MSARTPVLLVVDDNPQNLSLMCSVLERDYTLKLAPSAERALRIARSESPPDLILLDVVMPEMDGYEVCRQLKASPATADIPVIFVTSLSNDTDQQQGFDLGAVDYITKPVNPPLVHARVRAHLQIKAAREALERRNREDRENFERILAQQVAFSALKSSYLSMATHEFRTPLTSILSAQDLLLHYADKLAPAEREDVLLDIGKAAQRMMAMIDDVLELGRVEDNLSRFSPGPMALQPLVENTVREVSTAHRVGGEGTPASIRIDLAPECATLHADERLLRHILNNLLFNAVKYTPDGGEVALSARGEGSTTLIEVADQGIGIPADDMPRLFSTFFRASNVGKIPGTGLGLAIVKRAVETHRGEIAVTSTPGKGTRFTIRLPETLAG